MTLRTNCSHARALSLRSLGTHLSVRATGLCGVPLEAPPPDAAQTREIAWSGPALLVSTDGDTAGGEQ